MRVFTRARFASALAALCATAPAWAQTSPDEEPTEGDSEEPDEAEGSEESDQAEWALFPVIVYSPETSLMLGGLALYSFRLGEVAERFDGRPTRRSSLMSAVAYTFKNQFILDLSPNVYLQGETWNFGATVQGAWFPDQLWDIGNDSPEDSEEKFSKRALALELSATRTVYRALRAGLALAVRHLAYTETHDGGLLDTGQLPGSDGGFAVGAGPVILWDDRDNDFAAHHGGRYALSAMFHRHEVGSDYDYAEYVADARHYFLLPWDHAVAAQLLGRFTAGDVPFVAMSRLGGSNLMRGFFEGRYTDNHLLAAQVEYRLPLFWRFGLVAFVGTGRVASNAGELFEGGDPRPDDGEEPDIGFRFAGGGGIRWALMPRERANIRFDVAGTSTGDFNVYFNFGEAF